MESLEVGGRRVEITHSEKVLSPEAGITKRDLCDYYARVAEIMVPLVEDLIVSMHRFPDGILAASARLEVRPRPRSR